MRSMGSGFGNALPIPRPFLFCPWLAKIQRFLRTFASRREYPASPMIAVSAVVLDAGSVLLVRRGHAPLAGKWALPGGAVELGETLAQAIIRELQEETGLTVEPVAVLDALDKIERDADGPVRYHYALVVFLCRRTAGKLRAASDVADVRWFPVEELLDGSESCLGPDSLRLIELGVQRQ